MFSSKKIFIEEKWPFSDKKDISSNFLRRWNYFSFAAGVLC